MNKNYKIAPSYHNAEIISINEETHKAHIKIKCPRCNGLGIIVSRVENGKMIPIPVDSGICYLCNGEKYISKWVKAYTEKEYAQYLRTQERARERKKEKEEARLQELKDNSEANKKNLLGKWGYNVENPTIYLVIGNTYEIKEELKTRGGRYNPALNWYFTDKVEGYTLAEVPFDDVYEWRPMVKSFELKENAKEIAAAARISAMPESKSEWIGTLKERMRDLAVILTGARECSSYYGDFVLYTFEQGENHLAWFTTSVPKVEMVVGHSYLLTGTVKKFDERDGVKITQLNRCILKEN